MESVRFANGFIYVIESNGLYKIGRSEKLGKRIKQYETTNPAFEVKYLYPVTDPVKAEAKLLDFFRPKRVKGEWHRMEFGDLVDVFFLLDEEFLAFDPEKDRLERDNERLRSKLIDIQLAYYEKEGKLDKEDVRFDDF